MVSIPNPKSRQSAISNPGTVRKTLISFSVLPNKSQHPRKAFLLNQLRRGKMLHPTIRSPRFCRVFGYLFLLTTNLVQRWHSPLPAATFLESTPYQFPRSTAFSANVPDSCLTISTTNFILRSPLLSGIIHA